MTIAFCKQTHTLIFSDALVVVAYQVQVQVELYCHSAACGDIQWNELSCLTGPRCYINTDIQHYKPIHKLTY